MSDDRLTGPEPDQRWPRPRPVLGRPRGINREGGSGSRPAADPIASKVALSPGSTSQQTALLDPQASVQTLKEKLS